MGCDIHLVVEVRGADGAWKRDDRVSYGDRNYDAFAILAGVRNGYGFAGIKMSEPFEPIAEPRGLPADGTVREDDEDNWLGDHSFSWVTLAELLAVDWSKSVKHFGVISDAEYVGWKAAGGGRPGFYSGGISGPNIYIVSPDTMDGLIRDDIAGQIASNVAHGGPARNYPPRFYVRVSWMQTYAESAGNLFNKVIPALRELGAPDDVRLVFGFDS